MTIAAPPEIKHKETRHSADLLVRSPEQTAFSSFELDHRETTADLFPSRIILVIDTETTTVYANDTVSECAFNKATDRTGALFETPFHRKLVTREAHFSRLVTLIDTNPQKHSFVDDFRSSGPRLRRSLGGWSTGKAEDGNTT